MSLSSKEAVADTPKTTAVWLVECSCVTVTNALEKAVADPTWVQSATATRQIEYVVYNVVYMGSVSYSNKTWHVV